MLLKSFTLENIRIFKGINRIDFTPILESDAKKPIILIGGKNGSGKTTLFESILLCLYGQNTPGNRMGKAKYERYIRQMVSRNQVFSEPNNPAIEVCFEFSHSGETHEYAVRREWNLVPKFSENLIIDRDGKILSDLQTDQWQELLNELIPPRFARLFLFDGEKIQNLVEDQSDNLYLAESFKSLLGLDLVERLKADLSIYLSREIKSKEFKSISKKLSDIEINIREVEDAQSTSLQDKAQVQNEIDQIAREIERHEAKLASEGGSFARKRDDLIQEKSQMDEEIDRLENGIRDQCAGLFPFAITSKYCSQLKEHLIEEDLVQAKNRSHEIIRSRIDELTKIMQSAAFWKDLSISSSQKEKMKDRVANLIDQHLLVGTKSKDAPLTHHLSRHEYQSLMQWIEEALTIVPENMQLSSEKLEQLISKRQKITEMINKAPADDVIRPVIQTLTDLSQNLGQHKEKIRALDEKLKAYEVQLKDLERQKLKQQDEIQDFKTSSAKIHLAQQVSVILTQYMRDLQRQKNSQLSDNILACFTRLIRKDDYVSDILIDENYDITLLEPDGNSIPKELLSAGEKEIFAISLLWGLTLTSGRQLPFIIDTPLGRLDSEHRGNLVMDFFQNAGEQMIIFSTDTEIDQEYFRVLQPHIARAYHLDYSKKDRQTTITPGYFWEKDSTEVPS